MVSGERDFFSNTRNVIYKTILRTLLIVSLNSKLTWLENGYFLNDYDLM